MATAYTEFGTRKETLNVLTWDGNVKVLMLNGVVGSGGPWIKEKVLFIGIFLQIKDIIIQLTLKIHHCMVDYKFKISNDGFL